MSEVLTVQDGRVVQFHYVLTGDDGAVIDRSSDQPMTYLHGYGNIVPGLESALLGKQVGAKVRADVTPADAYGELDADAFQSVHRSEFPKNMPIEVGTPVQAQGSDGRVVTLWIHKTEGAQVTLTTNHPLAGQNLHFDVEIVGIREASEEERGHGHAHGPGGHHHH